MELRNTTHTWILRPSSVCAGSILIPRRRGEMLWRKEGSSCLRDPVGSRGPGAGSAAHCFTQSGSHQHTTCRATQASPSVQRGKILPVADTTAVVSALRRQTPTDPHPAELHPRHSSAIPLCLPPHRVCSGSSSASPALSPLRAPQPPGEG